MQLSRRSFAATMLLSFVAGPAKAQAFPSQNIKIVVPYPPGGGTDVLARLIAHKLGQRVGQTAIVENRPAAGGIIASTAVSGANPDGHTLLFGANIVLMNHVLDKANVPNPLDVFAPVTLYASAPLLVLVSAGTPVNSLKELVELAKRQPGKLNYASSGTGSVNHLAGALLCNVAGIELTHIPYKGVSPAMVDVTAGRVEIFISSAFSSMPQVKAGQVKVLAVAGEKRLSSLPDIPTTAEAGFDSFKIGSWWGMFAPRKTPTTVIHALREAIVSDLSAPDIKKILDDQDALSIGSTSEAFERFIIRENEKWTKVAAEEKLSKD